METKTIAEIYTEWIGVKGKLVKPSTVATYAVNAETHILPVFGGNKRIDNDGVQAFAFRLLGQGLAVGTVRAVLLVLKMVAFYGWRKGCFDWPDWDVRLPKDGGRGEPRVLTLGQQHRLMEHLLNRFSTRNLGIYICLCTGLRIGEICAMRWEDVDLDAKLISVRHTINRIYTYEGRRGRTTVVTGTPKTQSSVREIPISAQLMRLLKPAKSLSSPECFIITNTDKPLEPRLLRRHFAHMMAKLGMAGIKFHSLRHTFATRCIESGCDYKTVSALLGHANINTTLNLYVHPDMEQKRKCIDQMMRGIK